MYEPDYLPILHHLKLGFSIVTVFTAKKMWKSIIGALLWEEVE